MIIMAIDHTRDFTAALLYSIPKTLHRTNVFLFFTRVILCAPVLYFCRPSRLVYTAPGEPGGFCLSSLTRGVWLLVELLSRPLIITGISTLPHTTSWIQHNAWWRALSFWAVLRDPGYFHFRLFFHSFMFTTRYCRGLVLWPLDIALAVYMIKLRAGEEEENTLRGIGFIILYSLRSGNWYGDVARWFSKKRCFQYLCLLNVTKYPPSLCTY